MYSEKFSIIVKVAEGLLKINFSNPGVIECGEVIRLRIFQWALCICYFKAGAYPQFKFFPWNLHNFFRKIEVAFLGWKPWDRILQICLCRRYLQVDGIAEVFNVVFCRAETATNFGFSVTPAVSEAAICVSSFRISSPISFCCFFSWSSCAFGSFVCPCWHETKNDTTAIIKSNFFIEIICSMLCIQKNFQLL